MFIRIFKFAGKQILSSQVINFNLVECMRATVTAHLSCTHADCFRERPKVDKQLMGMNVDELRKGLVTFCFSKYGDDKPKM